jgi:hypothetical protein
MGMQTITKETLEVFAPEHDRTSCSDTNRCNGLDSALYHGRTGPRCTRCALLEILYEFDGEVPSNFKLVARMELKFEPQDTE